MRVSAWGGLSEPGLLEISRRISRRWVNGINHEPSRPDSSAPGNTEFWPTRLQAVHNPAKGRL
jgi:hypothetical protein